MPGAATTIRSGTRDELGGIDIGIANVWERDERPGVLSIALMAGEQQHILAVGDRIDLAGHAFILDAIELQSGGAYTCAFREIDSSTAPPPAALRSHPITPRQPEDFARQLREQSARLLAALGAPDLTPTWDHTSRDTYHREWNGEETGPITNVAWTAQLAGAEARVGLDLIRYNPGEIYRAEVSGFWKVGDRHLSLFARAEGNAGLTEVLASGDTEAVAQLLVGMSL